MQVVKEGSFTKAAAAAYMSQQAVSEHIRNLEERYGVRLFTRKPRLALTEEGEILRQALLQISNKEQDVKLRFEQLSKGVAGNINLGINSSRSSWLIPCFYTAYRSKFPHVSLSIYSDDTVRLTEQLRHGDLDIMFGVNAAFDESLDYLHLTDDSIYFVASRLFLKKRAGASDADIDDWTEGCVPAAVIERVPVSMNTVQSTLAKVVSHFFDEAHIAPELALRTSNLNTHINLCASHQVGAFLPTGIIPAVIERVKSTTSSDERLCVLRLPTDQAQLKLRIDCVLPGGSLAGGDDPLSALPAFKSTFITMLRQTCQSYTRLVDRWLPARRASTADIR